MSGSDASAASASAYDTIVDALASTARGRAFLAEHARRTRAEETGTLLDAIARLDTRLDTMRPPRDPGEIRAQANSLEQTILDMERCLRPDWLRGDADESDAPRDLADAVRTSASAVANAVESIHDIAWAMREAGFDAELCDRLDHQAATLNRSSTCTDAVATSLAGLVQSTKVAVMLASRLTSLTGRNEQPAPASAADGILTSSFADDIEFRSPDETTAGTPAPRARIRPRG